MPPLQVSSSPSLCSGLYSILGLWLLGHLHTSVHSRRRYPLLCAVYGRQPNPTSPPPSILFFPPVCLCCGRRCWSLCTICGRPFNPRSSMCCFGCPQSPGGPIPTLYPYQSHGPLPSSLHHGWPPCTVCGRISNAECCVPHFISHRSTLYQPSSPHLQPLPHG